jgi:hypothetical protein
MSPRIGTFVFVSTSRVRRQAAIITVLPLSTIIVETMFELRVRGRAIAPERPDAPDREHVEPGGASVEMPVPERLVSFGMTSMTMFCVPARCSADQGVEAHFDRRAAASDTEAADRPLCLARNELRRSGSSRPRRSWPSLPSTAKIVRSLDDFGLRVALEQAERRLDSA